MEKNPPAMDEMQVHSLGQEDPLGKETATHSSILAWESLWTEEPGRLESMGLQTVGLLFFNNIRIKLDARTYIPTVFFAFVL